MLKNHLLKLFVANLGYQPTNDQLNLFSKFSEYVLNNFYNKIIIVKGYAGTGKTSSMASIIKALDNNKIKSFLLAPTGRASKVFSSFTNKKAYTIHKMIYRQVSSKDGFGKFVLNFNKNNDTIFFVDEASMINNEDYESSLFGSGRLLEDLLSYIDSGNNCNLVIIGDTAQLPPVGLSASPALIIETFKSYGKDCEEINLTEVVRQAKSSGVLFNASRLRKYIDRVSDKESDTKLLSINGFNDIKSINGSELIECINDSYGKYGVENTIVICRSNKQANKYNLGIRNKIFYYESELVSGDLLMVVKNNYFWTEKYKTEEEGINFIANGDIVRIKRIKKIEEIYGFRFADITIELIDYENLELDVKIILNSISSDTASLTYDENKKLFYSILEDYQHIKPKKKQYDSVKNNEYFNALQVKFSYAITCHKAQGGQWEVVFVDHGFLKPESYNVEFFRWLYTAFTRTEKLIYIVNFNKDLLIDE